MQSNLGENKMTLPKVDDVIDNALAKKLCEYFGYTHLVERIRSNPGGYKGWVFDGASMIPDYEFSQFFNIPNLVEIALKHDLKYAYGESGNEAEKLQADQDFESDLLDDGASPILAKFMFKSVDKFGKEEFGTPFSWTFAKK